MCSTDPEQLVRQTNVLHDKICDDAALSSSCQDMTFVLLQGLLQYQQKQVELMAAIFKQLERLLPPDAGSESVPS